MTKSKAEARSTSLGEDREKSNTSTGARASSPIAPLTRAESGRAYALLKSYVGEPEDEVWWSLLSKLRVAADQ